VVLLGKKTHRFFATLRTQKGIVDEICPHPLKICGLATALRGATNPVAGNRAPIDSPGLGTTRPLCPAGVSGWPTSVPAGSPASCTAAAAGRSWTSPP